MGSLPPAFYLPDGDDVVATALTIGPWHAELQHGGPPAALLARAIARFGADAGAFFLARLAVDFIAPLRLGRMHTTVKPRTIGRRVQHLAATLTVDGTLVARATGLRVRRRSGLDTPAPPRCPWPEGGEPYAFPFFPVEIGYHRAVEICFARGRWGDRQVGVWMRPLVPLVAGEAPTPFERLIVVVDAESGVCPPVSLEQFTFLNPDLAVSVDREPEGDWFGLEVVSTASPLGVGLAQSTLYDPRGVFGRAAQSLLVEPR